MKKTRINRLIVNIHRWTGLTIGLFIIVIGVTGSLLVFLDELNLVTGEEKTVAIPDGARTLPIQSLLDMLQSQRPGWYVKTLVVNQHPDRAFTVYASQQGEALIGAVNPYTGVLLDSHPAGSGLMHLVYDLHTSLAISPWGDLVVALTALLLVVSSLTGLWVQRKFLWRVFAVGIRRNKSVKTAFSDTHKLAGALSLLTNLILGGTGVFITLYVYEADFLTEGHHHHLPQSGTNRYPFSLDNLVHDANRRVPGFRLNYIDFPASPDGTLTINGRTSYGTFFYTPAYGSAWVEYQTKTGRWVSTSDLRYETVGKQLSSFLHELHYGKFAGLGVKLLYFLGGLMPVVLAITGFVVWRKKTAKRRFRP